MMIMLGAFLLVEILSSRSLRARAIKLGVLAFAALALPSLVRAQSDELIGVTPHWEGIKEEFSQGFAKRYKERTGREVTIRWLDVGGTSDIIRYLKSRSKPGSPPLGIDLLFGGGPDSLLELSRSGVLEPVELDPAILSAIPPTLAGMPIYSPQHDWFSVAFSTFGILVNKVGAQEYGLPVPHGWGDLASDVYANALALGDPRKSGSMHAMFEVILQGYGWERGWEILTRMTRNARIITSAAAQVGKEVASGEGIVGIAIDTNAGDVIRRVGAERVGFIIPEDFASINGDGIAVLKGAPNLAVAKAFIEYQLSEEGQRLWYLKVGTPGGPKKFEIGKLPVRPSVYGSGESAVLTPGNPYEWRNVLLYNSPLASARWNILNDLFGVYLIDLQDALRSAGSLGDFLRAPLSESETLTLSPNGEWGRDQVLRNREIQEWRRDASQKVPREPFPQRLLQVAPGLSLILFILFASLRKFARSFAR
jgi:ABC-type Fe3+ transport system substrate-binding protein